MQTDPLPAFSKDTIHSHPALFLQGPGALVITSAFPAELPVVLGPQTGHCSLSISLSPALSPPAFSCTVPSAGLSLPF